MCLSAGSTVLTPLTLSNDRNRTGTESRNRQGEVNAKVIGPWRGKAFSWLDMCVTLLPLQCGFH